MCSLLQHPCQHHCFWSPWAGLVAGWRGALCPLSCAAKPLTAPRAKAAPTSSSVKMPHLWTCFRAVNHLQYLNCLSVSASLPSYGEMGLERLLHVKASLVTASFGTENIHQCHWWEEAVLSLSNSSAPDQWILLLLWCSCTPPGNPQDHLSDTVLASRNIMYSLFPKL